MYFASRLQAGRMLAEKLEPKYKNENCAVMALSDGGAMVGAQIASRLKCVLTLLNTTDVPISRDPDPFGGITPGGKMDNEISYTDDAAYELPGESFLLDQYERMAHLQEIRREFETSSTLSYDLVRDRDVILVADGLKTGFALELAFEFLKPIGIKKTIVAVPLASVAAVDRMHILADELCCLSVISDYMDTDHYYDKQDVPDHQTVMTTIEELVSKWQPAK